MGTDGQTARVNRDNTQTQINSEIYALLGQKKENVEQRLRWSIDNVHVRNAITVLSVLNFGLLTDHNTTVLVDEDIVKELSNKFGLKDKYSINCGINLLLLFSIVVRQTEIFNKSLNLKPKEEEIEEEVDMDLWSSLNT